MGVIASVGAAQSYTGGNGGKTYAINNVSNLANIQVAPSLPSRRKITFINPGSSVILYVSMVNQINPITGVQSPLIPTTTVLGGTVPVFPGAFVTFEGECQCAWQALAASGVSNPLTVVDSFV
jgi:hypothetical protein